MPEPLAQSQGYQPLALRMRPRCLREIIGQDALLGAGQLLPRLIARDAFGSLILYGPPGSGKTSLAEVIAAETKSQFVRVNAVLSNVAEMREILKMARLQPERHTIVFIDEIHRFNKSQQDLLLPDVEAGHVRLIGVTAHNPSFYLNAPLLSRSHLFKLELITTSAIVQVLRQALADKERGLGTYSCQMDEAALKSIARLADGDLRRALNTLESLILSQPNKTTLTSEQVATFARERRIRYDSDEDEHYDTVSAFIKSVRGGDPDAALYWLAKMLAGGEDPRFIARRLVILASEDVGLSDSRGLLVAVAAFQACEYVGLPECEYALAHATLFLATAPKSNSATLALAAAKKGIADGPLQAVPLWLRKRHAPRSLRHGKGYRYSHDFPEAISGQAFMETPQQFYQPKTVGAEAAIAERLARWKQLRIKEEEKLQKKT